MDEARALVLREPGRLTEERFDLPRVGDDDGLLRVEGLPRIPFTRLDLTFRWKPDGGGWLGGRAAAVDPCAEPPAEPIAVVFSHGGSYRGPAGSVPG